MWTLGQDDYEVGVQDEVSQSFVTGAIHKQDIIKKYHHIQSLMIANKEILISRRPRFNTSKNSSNLKRKRVDNSMLKVLLTFTHHIKFIWKKKQVKKCKKKTR